MTNSFPPNSPSPFQLPNQGNASGSASLADQVGHTQTLFSPNTPQQFKAKKKASAGKWVAGLLGLSILLTGGYFWGKTQGLLPQTPELPQFTWFSLPNTLFQEGTGITHAQAQTLYRESLQALKNQQPQEALTGFNKLEKAYPGLAELIWLHQAESYAGLGEEANAQARLKMLLSRFPNSPLALKARYLLAQSHLRASESELAKREFLSLQQKVPTSDYGIGSLYYLGLLSENKNPNEARPFWLSYLKQCPQCRFSGDSAEALQRQIESGAWKQVTPEEHSLIGIGLASSDRQWNNVLTHLQQAPLKNAWFYLAKAWLKEKQPEKASTTFLNGLTYSTNVDQSQEAIDWLFRSNNDQAINQLESLTKSSLPLKGDYLLWQLAQAKPSAAAAYYQQILSRYPTGDYAPESSWNLLWPLVQSGQYTAYISGANHHIQQYPYARSTPKVLFWVAKSLEKSGNTAQAQTTYQNLLTNYPNQYYSFRAQQRLDALQGRADTAWTTRVLPYQPNFSLASIHILPDRPLFLKHYQEHQGNTIDTNRVYRAMEELQAIGAADDMLLVAESSLPEIPPAIVSWSYQMNNERPKGLRVIRDALQERLKTDSTHAASVDERKLLYPVNFAPQIAENSPKFGIDPYIVQGLMREESYFNEFAISSSNARGLMQLLPTTAADVVAWEKLPGFSVMSLFDPGTNIHLGTRYLRFLHDQFADLPPNTRSMAAVGAYNGGPNAMRRWITANPNFSRDPDLFVEEIPYEQTRDYIKKVFGSAWNYQQLYGSNP